MLWQDGSPFTVDDVVASFDRITDPKVGSAALSAFAGVLSNGNIEKVDAQTVKFHLDRPYGDFPTLVSSFNYNSVILPKDYKEGTFTKGGIGTGPFILKTFSADQGASYVKNPKYWGGPTLPYLDAVQIKYFADTPPIVLAIQGGSIDVFPQVPYQGSQGAVLGCQHPRQRDAVERVPHAADAGRPGPLEAEGGAPGAGVLARPARPRPGPAGRQGRARQRPRVRAHLPGIADLRGGAAAAQDIAKAKQLLQTAG